MPAFVPFRMSSNARRRCTPYSRLDIPVLNNDDFLRALALTRVLTGQPEQEVVGDLVAITFHRMYPEPDGHNEVEVTVAANSTWQDQVYMPDNGSSLPAVTSNSGIFALDSLTSGVGAQHTDLPTRHNYLSLDSVSAQYDPPASHSVPTLDLLASSDVNAQHDDPPASHSDPTLDLLASSDVNAQHDDPPASHIDLTILDDDEFVDVVAESVPTPDRPYPCAHCGKLNRNQKEWDHTKTLVANQDSDTGAWNLFSGAQVKVFETKVDALEFFNAEVTSGHTQTI